jgi:hypothetical protein
MISFMIYMLQIVSYSYSLIFFSVRYNETGMSSFIFTKTSNSAKFKFSLTRDFRLVFLTNQFPPGPLVSHWGHFRIFTKIRGDIRISAM